MEGSATACGTTGTKSSSSHESPILTVGGGCCGRSCACVGTGFGFGVSHRQHHRRSSERRPLIRASPDRQRHGPAPQPPQQRKSRPCGRSIGMARRRRDPRAGRAGACAPRRGPFASWRVRRRLDRPISLGKATTVTKGRRALICVELFEMWEPSRVNKITRCTSPLGPRVRSIEAQTHGGRRVWLERAPPRSQPAHAVVCVCVH